MRFGPLYGSAEVEAVRVEFQAFGRNFNPAKPIRLSHVENDFLVDQQFVMQSQVVAVGVQLGLDERFDNDIRTKPGVNLVAAQNHDAVRQTEEVPGGVFKGTTARRCFDSITTRPERRTTSLIGELRLFRPAWISLGN